MRRTILTFLILTVFVFPFYPAQAVGLNFGGRITSSQFRVCNLYVGVATIPFPLQVMRVYRTGAVPITIVYPYYALLLQLFGVTTTIYSYGTIYRAGPNVLGQYVPAPIPWINCPDLIPTNIITKIGTSLF